MKRIGRNERCPCGSGRKYKQCCLDWHASAAHTFVAQPPEAIELTERSIAEATTAIDALVGAGRLDEAEARCHALLGTHPEAHEALERLGPVLEARGDRVGALAQYRRLLAYIDVLSPEVEYESAVIADLCARVARLEAGSPA